MLVGDVRISREQGHGKAVDRALQLWGCLCASPHYQLPVLVSAQEPFPAALVHLEQDTTDVWLINNRDVFLLVLESGRSRHDRCGVW